MAATADGTATQAGTSASAATLTITGKTTAGSNRVGTVSAAWNDQNSVITGATWNGVAMTILDQGAEVTNASISGALLWIAAPPTASSSIVLTFAGGSPPSARAIAHSYQDASQTAPTGGAIAKVISTVLTATMSSTVTTASGELIVDALSWTQFDTVAATIGANQTNVDNTVYGSFYYLCASQQNGSDGGVMSWAAPGSGGNFVSISASLGAAASSLTAAQEAGIFAAMNSGGVIGRVDA